MSRNTRLLIVGLIVMIAAWLVPVLVPSLMIGARALPVLVIITAVTMIILITLITNAPAGQSPEKRKRESEAGDVFLNIEQMVNDLNDNELRYLQRLLDERRERARQIMAGDNPPEPGDARNANDNPAVGGRLRY